MNGDNYTFLADTFLADTFLADTFLADTIYTFHIFIVLFILIAPFSNIPAILILHIVFGIGLIIHWLVNSNNCILTILESQLRGISQDNTFSHQFISPIYDISETEWSTFCYVITIFLIIVSLYRLQNLQEFKQAVLCYNDHTKTAYEKVFCFINLLRIA